MTGVLSALEFFLGVEELHWGYLRGTQRKIGRTRAGVVLPESLAILSSPATRSTLFFTLLFFSLSHNYDHHTVLSDGIPSLVSRDQSSSPHLISLLSFPSPVRSAGHRPLPLLAYPHIARVANSYRLARTSPSPIAQTKGTPGKKDPSYQGSFSSDLSTLYYCIFICSLRAYQLIPTGLDCIPLLQSPSTPPSRVPLPKKKKNQIKR